MRLARGLRVAHLLVAAGFALLSLLVAVTPASAAPSAAAFALLTVLAGLLRVRRRPGGIGLDRTALLLRL